MSIKKNINILVVDDDKMLADSLTEYLGKLGYNTSAVYDANEAIERFVQGNYQFVITDLVMFDMDGIELMDTIKSIDKNAIVIVVTGYASNESAVDAIKKGAYDFIPKPFNMKELEVVIDRALERYSIFRQIHTFRRMFYSLLIMLIIILAAILMFLLM